MPWVTIRTGVVGTDGRETILREYLCDWSAGCANVAEHVLATARDVGLVCAVCSEHAAMVGNRTSESRAD
jgi:hypothetical protein